MSAMFLCAVLVLVFVAVVIQRYKETRTESTEHLPDVSKSSITASEVGADVNAREKDGNMALCTAAKNGKTEEVNALIRAGADVNTKGEFGITPLMLAARFNSSPDVVNALIDAGADVNIRDMFGETALMGAALNSGNPEAVKALIMAGADVSVKNFAGISAIDFAQTDEMKRIILNAAK